MQTLVCTDIPSSECQPFHSFSWSDIMPYQIEEEEDPTDMMALLPESFFLSTTTTTRKRIQFATHAQVRTYETILGYHPACRDGLALQCGWAYAETEYVPLSTTTNTTNTTSRKGIRRLDQITRRQRLREVTGMSHLQLLQVANELLHVCWR